MIDRALGVLSAQLDEALRQRFGASAPVAALGSVPDLSKDNGAAVPAQPVTLTLVRVEEERSARVQVATRRRPEDDAIEEAHPEVKLYLYLLISAAAKDYGDALKYLSAVVGFFQARPVLDRASTPGLDPALEKLRVELYTQSFEEQNHLWGTLSLRYVPSVLYRVRLVVIQETPAARLVPHVTTVQVRQQVREVSAT